MLRIDVIFKYINLRLKLLIFIRLILKMNSFQKLSNYVIISIIKYSNFVIFTILSLN